MDPIVLHTHGMDPASSSPVPVSSGIPFAKGAMLDSNPLALHNACGTPLATQTDVLSRWDDGSIRWLLVSTQLRGQNADEGVLTLKPGESVTPDNPVLCTQHGNELELNNGILTLRTAPDQLLGQLTLAGKNVFVDGATPDLQIIEADGTVYTAGQGKRMSTSIEYRGPLTATVRLEGELADTDGHHDYGYVLRATLYYALRRIRLYTTFIVRGDQPTRQIDRISLNWRNADVNEPDILLPRGGWRPLNGSLTCRQYEHDHYRITSDDPALDMHPFGGFAGWCALRSQSLGHSLGLALRHFSLLHPKQLALHGDGRTNIDLYSRNDDAPPLNLAVGRCKGHDLLLTFENLGDYSLINTLESFDHLPTLRPRPDYVSKTNVFGPLPSFTTRRGKDFLAMTEQTARLEEFEQDSYPQHATGMLHHGDWFYFGAKIRPGVWTVDVMYSDGEGDVPHVYDLLYLITGKNEYFRRARDGAVHLAEVDTDHVGGALRYHGYAGNEENHEDKFGVFETGHVWLDGICNHYVLTGEKHAIESAVKIADFLCQYVATLTSMGQVSPGIPRGWGWVTMSLLRVHQETGEPRYLEVARQIIDFVVRYVEDVEKVMEEETNVYWGPNWMQEGSAFNFAALVCEAMMRYEEWTGDTRVRNALIKSAAWTLQHCYDHELDSLIHQFNGISFNRRFHCYPRNLSWLDSLAYAYKHTQDRMYLDAALRIHDTSVRRALEQFSQVNLAYGFRDSLRFYALLEQIGDVEPPDKQTFKKRYNFNLPAPRATGQPASPFDGLLANRKPLFAVSFEHDLEPQIAAANTRITLIDPTPVVVAGEGLKVTGIGRCTYTDAGNVKAQKGTASLWYRHAPDDPASSGFSHCPFLIHIHAKPYWISSIWLSLKWGLRLNDERGRLTAVLQDIPENTSGVELMSVNEHMAGDGWMHYAFTWQTAQLSLYVNGQHIATSNDAVVAKNEPTVIDIGSRIGGLHAQGRIRNVKFYDVVAANTAIEDLYQSERPLFIADTTP